MSSAIVPFNNQTPEGSMAFRRGNVVPPDAVNLSWVKSPEISPEQNVIVIDTSQITPANINESVSGFYYADELGILQDVNGNQLFGEEFPYITDIFSTSGDLTGVDISNETIFPFVHVSRYFHIDVSGLCLGSGLTNFTSNLIKVTTAQGNQYLDANGNPLYTIQICPALNLNIPLATQEDQTTQQPYRVYVYLDPSSINQTLYLTYDKIEISNSGLLVNQILNYTETINSQPVYKFRPEPAEVVDLANRDKKWYSARDASYYNQILGQNAAINNGYNIFAPKKALNDPRLFETFRWRVTCNFSQNFAVEQDQKTLNVGVIITNNDTTSIAAQAWNALAQESVNLNNIQFVNPLASITDSTQDAYWYVNIDALGSNYTQQLAQFDILLWIPTADYFDFSVYIGQINYFTNILGKTLFIDTDNGMVPINLGITTTDAIASSTGQPYHSTSAPSAFAGPAVELTVNSGYTTSALQSLIDTYANPTTSYATSVPWTYSSSSSTYSTGAYYNQETLFDATALGGWNITSSTPISKLQTDYGISGGHTQFITSMPTTASNVVLLALSNNQTINSPTAPSTTWSYLNNTGSFGYVQSALNTTPIIGTYTLQVTVPSVPSGKTYLRTEVFQSTIFTGASGSAMGTYLNGGSSTAGFNDLEHIASITSGGTATIFAGDYSTDATLPGSVINTQAINIINGTPLNSITYQSLRATTFYYTPSTTTTNVTVAPNTNFTIPVFSGIPVIVQNGNLYFSTFNILSSAATGLSGAAQFLYNLCLVATQNLALTTNNSSSYASSYSFSSPWALSWVINTTTNPDVLSAAEKATYNFVYLPEDVDNPTYVWQRQLSAQNLASLINNNMSPQMLADTAHSTRSYVIEVTNSNVMVPTTLSDTSLPYAWTLSYTPTLQIPADYSTYIIQEKEIPAEYEAGQYISRSYPYRPYAFQVTSTYDGAFTLSSNQSTTWNAICTATLTYDSSVYVPPKTIETTKTSTLWVPETTEISLSWGQNSTSGSSILTVNPYQYGTVNLPNGIYLWTQANYHNTSFGPGQDNFVFNGLTGLYEIGSTGTPVQFLQDVLNKVISAGLVVDGYYGEATANAVRSLQTLMGARYIDGVVDAETWSLVGGAVISHGLKNSGQAWGQFYDFAYMYMQPKSISDGNEGTIFGKRSWVSNGPSMIWEIFAVYFGASNIYNIHGITFTPYLIGSSNTMLFEAVHASVVTNPYTALVNFDSKNMMIKNMNRYVEDNQSTTINFAPMQANFIMVGVGQDRTSFPITSRFLGVRDITAQATITTETPTTTHTLVKTTIPGYTKTSMATKTVTLTSTGTTTVSPNTPTVINCTPNFTGQGSLSNITWTLATSSNPNVTASITSRGQLTLTNNAFTSNLGVTTNQGPLVNATQAVAANLVWYSMNTNGNVNPWQETGTISKDEGLILFCNQNGSPFGFPSIPPSQTATQRLLTAFRLASLGTDQHVLIGFYDIVRNEFITDANGNPVVGYNDYIARGPNNIYVAAISSLEIDQVQSLPTFSATNQTLTNANDAPYIPNMLVLPVYGVVVNTANRIGLAKLPPNLGKNDIWPIAVRPGKFISQFIVPPNSTQFQYQAEHSTVAPGATITAYYQVDISSAPISFSCLFGPPNVDIIGETPTIIDTNILQVAQAPILMQRFPTNYDGPADPTVPIFAVYQRATITSPWEALAWNQIADYDITTGQITLQNAPWYDDPDLWMVNYTSSSPYYIVKMTDIIDYTQSDLVHVTVPVDLNPLHGFAQVNETLYVYVTPTLMLDNTGYQIALKSPYQHPISYTTNSDLFNPNSSIFDPSAVLIGLIRVANNFDVSQLVMIDSRVRGGGIPNDIQSEQAFNTVQEAINYWDINYGTGMSYQNSGFILIRFPAALKGVYPDSYIREVIDKNITAGVAYKIEDLDGNDWDLI